MPLGVIVYPSSPTGGRRVRVDGEILGLAHSDRDLIEFLRRAGLADADEQCLRTAVGKVCPDCPAVRLRR
jgi:hypothetical protein